MKRAIIYVRQRIGDFTRGCKILWRILWHREDLASMSRTVEGLIPVYGKHTVRQQVIKAIENDIKQALKKGDGAVDKLIAKAFACPEYVKLLRRLGIDEPNIRALVVMVKREAKRR